MEAITAARLSKVAEEASLLAEIQMGFRKERSTESALFLLTSQLEKVWKKGIVASLLSLDISGVYDRVLSEVLQQILERKVQRKNYKSFLLKSGKTNRKRRKEEATQVGRLSAQSHTKTIWSSTKSYRKLRQVYYYKSELGELVWQVFYSELEFLILLPFYVCVAKQRKL